MSHPVLNQLSRAEELFDGGKLEEALEILNHRGQFEELNSQQKEHFQFLKGLILFSQWKHAELCRHGQEIFKEGQNLNDILQSLDGLFFIIAALGQANRFKEAIQKFETAEVLLELNSNEIKAIFTQKKARMRLLKGWINLESNNLDVAEKNIEWVLNIQNDLGNTFEIVWATLLKARLKYRGKGRYDLCGEYARKAFSMAKQIKFNHFWIALCQVILGALYSSLGEIDLSLKNFMKSLVIFRKIKSNYWTAFVLNGIGSNYYELGNFNLSLKYYEECLSIHEKLTGYLVLPLSNLVEVALEIGDNELARQYFNRLITYYNPKEDRLSELAYLFSKALMLKKSARIRDKAKAEKILKIIINTDALWKEFAIDATIHLCDLLLSEYHFTNSNEVLEELNHYIANLLTIAEKTRSYVYSCNTFILQAKLALIQNDSKSARRFLTRAQKIAESYGMKRLVMKISYEHDKLLRLTKIWESINISDLSLSERFELSGLNEQMEDMVKRRMVKLPEISKEEPVMLLILTEGGDLMFSKRFVEDISLEDDILGGFLTTINYIITEVFSEGLERAVFGQYTLLMMPLKPFLVCYIFKGYSYYAHRKTKQFLESIQNDDHIWKSLQISLKESKIVQPKSIPSLQSLILEIFVKVKN